MNRFGRRWMGRGWADFAAPEGFVHAQGGQAIEGLGEVCAALRERVGAVAYAHVVATHVGSRQVIGARAIDEWGRCPAWVLLVELDGALPPLRLAPQGFDTAGDPEVGDQAFDRMYRLECPGAPDDTWARQFCSVGVRHLLTTNRALEVAVVHRHLVHVRVRPTSPAEALATFGEEGRLLVEVADALPPQLYAAYGSAAAPTGGLPDVAVVPEHSSPREDTEEWPLLGGPGGGHWPLLADADGADGPADD